MQNDLRKIYDRFAETYDKNRGLFDMTTVIDDFYRRLPCRTGRLLDLGCGAGEPFPAYFIEQGWQVTGVDFSSKMLELAHQYQPAMQTILADIRDIDFADEQFNAITAIYCLFHIEHEQHEEIFRKIHRWLKPGGMALFTYATREYTGADIFNDYKEFMGQNLFYSHSTPEKLDGTLKTAGFEIESLKHREIGGETFLWVTVAKD
jgi:cyclopropane fatty-acyl-phospholipid synthase-like methyltransferase